MSTTSPDWFPAAPDARVTFLVFRDVAPPTVEEAVTSGSAGQLVYGLRFAEGDRNPGYDLDPAIAAVLLTDAGGPLHDGQRVDPARLNAAVDKVRG